MREDQIVRYGRQILLREVGGRGQERLLASPVRVLGSGPGIEDAVAWLLAGGTPIELAAGVTLGGFLTGAGRESLNPDAAPLTPAVAELLPLDLTSSATTQVVIGAGIAFRGPDACPACWALTRQSLTVEPSDGPMGSLAALALQRLVLGWSDPLGIVRWSGARLETGVLPTCHHTLKHQQ